MQGLLRRVRHIDLRVCWIQAALQQGLITLNWVSGLQNPADLFTKALSKPQSHMSRIGIVEHCPRVQLETATLDVDVERLCSMMYRFVNVTALERLSCELDALNYQKTRWVVVEFCTSVNSGMRQASKEIEHVCVVCITEDETRMDYWTRQLLWFDHRLPCGLSVESACWSGVLLHALAVALIST